MRPAAKIVNIFAAWFSNCAIRMIFDSPFNQLVMHSHHRILSCWLESRWRPHYPVCPVPTGWPGAQRLGILAIPSLKALDDLNFS